MNRIELYDQARRHYNDAAPAGDAWRGIYEIACEAAASRKLMKSQLSHAANDEKSLPSNRSIYQNAADSLDRE